jgi:hypothetical protein
VKLTENHLVTVISFSFYQKTDRFLKSNRTNFTENRKNQPVFNYCNPCSREVSTGISLIHAPQPSSKYGYQVPTSPLPIFLTAVDVAVFGTTSIQFRAGH